MISTLSVHVSKLDPGVDALMTLSRRTPLLSQGYCPTFGHSMQGGTLSNFKICFPIKQCKWSQTAESNCFCTKNEGRNAAGFSKSLFL